MVEEVTTDWCGEIVAVDRDLDTLTLEDRRGKRRTFPLGPGFLLDGKPVVLTAPTRAAAPAQPTRTASGSVAVHGAKARVARASRIFVEGRHDAELVEKVWGDDLRIEGVVVEYLGGVDDLADHLRDFKPGPERRVGVLVDHLVTGSKESRIAQGIAQSPVGKHVLIVGHPFIDIWAAVKPARLGLQRWPDVPRDIEWKKGVCQQLGWPHRDQTDIARAWQHILGEVSSFTRPRPGPAGPGRGADRLRDGLSRRLEQDCAAAEPCASSRGRPRGSDAVDRTPRHGAPTPQVDQPTRRCRRAQPASPMYGPRPTPTRPPGRQQPATSSASSGRHGASRRRRLGAARAGASCGRRRACRSSARCRLLDRATTALGRRHAVER